MPQTALIVGAGDNLGAALARRFARVGLHVVVSRRRGDLSPLVNQIEAAGGQATGLHSDARDEDAVRELVAGILMSGPGVGVIISGFVAPLLVQVAGFEPWQVSWLLFAAISAAVAVLALVLIRDHPADIGSEPLGIASKGRAQTRLELSRRVRLRLLAHMGIIFALYGTTYMAYVTFISLFSGILFGSISDRIGRQAGMAVAFAVLATAYLLVGFTNWLPGLYLSILLFGLAAWSIPVIMSASAGDYFGPAGTANALAALVLIFSVGQAARPLVAGHLADITGDFTFGYLAAGLICHLTILLITMMRPPGISK